MDEPLTKTDMVVASIATLIDAQCVEATEAMGVKREHLASVISSAVNVRTAEDITTLNAGATTSLRGVVILKARVLKEAWNITTVISVEKDGSNGNNVYVSQTQKKKSLFYPCINFIFLEDRENWRYFGLKTAIRGVVEFECKNKKEHDVWAQGVSRLLTIAADKNNI
ncbi:VAN3-binding protein-like [Hibiscus syriacus]|uniref:VAN3-binding protein-like n=1 Tax=Hibiscus syriacus TaxID=106335 RepID=UPI00192142BD|nr:VAN3-binding protein-like [Hibiscus syriacus]